MKERWLRESDECFRRDGKKILGRKIKKGSWFRFLFCCCYSMKFPGFVKFAVPFFIGD